MGKDLARFFWCFFIFVLGSKVCLSFLLLFCPVFVVAFVFFRCVFVAAPFAFYVVSRRFQRHFVQRFSATRSLFVFAPWNKLRCCAVYISTTQYFDYVVMLTILINCVFLAMKESVEEAK